MVCNRLHTGNTIQTYDKCIHVLFTIVIDASGIWYKIILNVVRCVVYNPMLIIVRVCFCVCLYALTCFGRRSNVNQCIRMHIHHHALKGICLFYLICT